MSIGISNGWEGANEACETHFAFSSVGIANTTVDYTTLDTFAFLDSKSFFTDPALSLVTVELAILDGSCYTLVLRSVVIEIGSAISTGVCGHVAKFTVLATTQRVFPS